MIRETATMPADNAAAASDNPLLDLPPAALGTLRGERREQCIAYLLRWRHGDVLRGYLDVWLDAQPHAATLRTHMAHALALTGEPDAALAVLDALDAERGPTRTRDAIRWDALVALGRHDDLLALAPRPDDESPTFAYHWLRHGDALRAAGNLEGAAEAYTTVTAMQPDAAPLRRLAELALAAGDAAAARGHLETLFVRNAERPPTVEELRLLRQVVVALDDAAATRSLDAQLVAREREERDTLVASLGVGSRQSAVGSETQGTDVAGGDESLSVPDGEQPTADSQLPTEAYAALRDDFGLADFRPNQAATVAHALAGRAALAVMPTGAGKSLTYQLPALLLPHATLVVSPLIALMKDQVDNLPPALREQATAINSSLSAGEVRDRLRGVAGGAYKLVYVAPERLRNRPFLHALRRAGVSLFVVDEAHCVSMWGLSFRPDYLFLDAAIRALGSPPVLALTATAGVETQAEIAERLGTTERVLASVFRPNLRFEVLHAGNKAEKRDAVVKLCAAVSGPIIVYARSRDACEELATHLRQRGVSAAHYHAQTPDRAQVQERFMAGETRVLVATVAFGMGVDKADVRAIIHFNLPQSVEAYYQEAGRAGRDGQPARCVLLYSGSDKSQMMRWLKDGAITKDHLRHLYRTLRGMVGSRWSAVGSETGGASSAPHAATQRRSDAATAYGIVSLDDVGRAAARVNADETFARVGVSMLERVGLVRRHFDVPRQITVTLRSGDAEAAGGGGQSAAEPVAAGFSLPHVPDTADCPPPPAAFDAFIAATGLYLGEAGEYDLLDLAGALGIAPDALEAAMLGWHDMGLIRYAGAARDALIELLPAPADVGERIDALLSDYAARQEARVEAMAAYARGAMCRHATIAAHFGQQLGRCGTACDICLSRAAGGRRQGASGGVGFGPPPANGGLKPAPPKKTLSLPRDDDPRPDALRVLAGVAALPYPMGRSGLEKTLRGASTAPPGAERCAEYGALRGRTGKAIEELIEQLVGDSLIARDTSTDRRALSLTREGCAALSDPTRLPEWVQTAAEATTEPDVDVVAALKAWRLEKARERDVAPFVIMWNSTLDALATARPRSEFDLLQVKGIGQKFVEQYGDELLALLM